MTSQLTALAEAGALTASDLTALASLLGSGGLTSVTSLDGLSSVVQAVVRDAFRDGVRWSFLSLLPWLGVGCVVSMFLGRIADSDKEGEGEEVGEGEGEGEGKGKRGSGKGSETELAEITPRTDGDVEAGAEVAAQ